MAQLEQPEIVSEPEPISYESFVEQEIKDWKNKGIEWQYPQNNDDNKDNGNTIKYSNEIIEEFIMNVYKTTTLKNKTCKFVKLLLLFCHQIVIGRIFASYSQ